LDPRAARERRGLHGRSRGWSAGEELLVDLVHRCEVLHVGEEYRRLDHVAQREARRFEQRRDVLPHALGFGADPSAHHLTALGVDAHLTRGEEHAPPSGQLDELGGNVGTDRLGGTRACDRGLHGSHAHSTVTLFARLRGWSTSQPRRTAMWYASSWSGITLRMGVNIESVAGT